MSSATSIDSAAADRVAGGARRSDDSLRPWHFFVLASLLAATAAVVMSRQARPEQLIVISLTIGAAGFAGAALYRTLVPLVLPEQPSGEPLTDSMRAILEREKALALRAIKELEFDRAMGKVSPRDFDEMAGRLRARAISLMKQLDAGGYRELIERELEARLRKPSARAKSSVAPTAARANEPAGRTVCACGTVNDRDAAFCKRCGVKLAAATEG
jgi:hypothetical protein